MQDEATTIPLSRQLAKKLLPARPAEGHKYTFGHVLVIGGSKDKPGAAALASEAVLAAGAGAVTLAAPDSVFEAGIVLPEVMRLARDDVLQDEVLSKFDVCAVGPGLGDTAETRAFFEKLLSALTTLEKPVVLDADALNILSHKPQKLSDTFILTPHIGEARRLLGAQQDMPYQEMAKDLQEKYGAVIVLKSARTLITASDGKIWESITENSGLATAGSGDVLTGVIAALMAQGCKPLEAAQLGVYLHARAGELASAEYTEYGARAGLVSELLAPALKELMIN